MKTAKDNGLRMTIQREKEEDLVTEWRSQNARKSLEYSTYLDFSV